MYIRSSFLHFFFIMAGTIEIIPTLELNDGTSVPVVSALPSYMEYY